MLMDGTNGKNKENRETTEHATHLTLKRNYKTWQHIRPLSSPYAHPTDHLLQYYNPKGALRDHYFTEDITYAFPTKVSAAITAEYPLTERCTYISLPLLPSCSLPSPLTIIHVRYYSKVNYAPFRSVPFEPFSRVPLPQTKHVREALGIENINNYVYCKAPSFRDALTVGG